MDVKIQWISNKRQQIAKELADYDKQTLEFIENLTNDKTRA